MKPPPAGWPRISAAVFYEDAARAITWLCGAFGFEVALRVDGEGGAVEHSQLVLDGGLVMVSTLRRAAGAVISIEPTTSDYGPGYWEERGYETVDPEGHRWWFLQRLRG